jgi:hypothetical protein
MSRSAGVICFIRLQDAGNALREPERHRKKDGDPKCVPLCCVPSVMLPFTGM